MVTRNTFIRAAGKSCITHRKTLSTEIIHAALELCPSLCQELIIVVCG
jgi:hypothetical protein